MKNVHSNIEKLMGPDEKGTEGSSASNTDTGVENGMIGAGFTQQQGLWRFGDQLQQQQGMDSSITAGIQGGQRSDTQGEGWLTTANMPIDASMFESQDWNFTVEDWNNFEARMVQPAGGTWLGYLL